MPRLVSLTLRMPVTSAAAVRRFAESRVVPAARPPRSDRLHAPDRARCAHRSRAVALRHLRLGRNEVRRVGCEALRDCALRVFTARARPARSGGLLGRSAGAGRFEDARRPEAPRSRREPDRSRRARRPGGEPPSARPSRARSGAAQFRARADRGPRRLGVLERPRIARTEAPEPRPVAGRHSGRETDRDAAPIREPDAARTIGVRPRRCRARAIIRSKTLGNLVVLDLSANKLGRGAARLASRKVLPRLAHCRLGVGVPKSTAARLRRRPGVRV